MANAIRELNDALSKLQDIALEETKELIKIGCLDRPKNQPPYIMGGVNDYIAPNTNYRTENLSVIDVKDIVKMLCEIYDITFAQLVGPSRAAPLVDCRYAIFYLLRSYLRIRPFQIAKLLNRDNSTIRRAVRNIDVVMNYNTTVREATIVAKTALDEFLGFSNANMNVLYLKK